ncbi:MAG: ATP-binding protein [archaeon]
MITKEVLRQVVNKQKSELTIKKNTVKREVLDEILKWMKDDRVIILTGIRRCGKSTLLKQIMHEITEWSYINFEDERLLDFNAADFEVLNEALIEAYGTTKTYLFDEVQNVPKFETFIRRLADEGKKVIITGSNAALLSKEFGTRLTGRYKSFEVFPFSFLEFLKYKEESLSTNDWHIIDKKVKLLKLFCDYQAIGGMPEYVKNLDKDYIRTVFENILYKDIITRYSIRREKILKELVNILATNAASKFTYNSLKNTLALSNANTVKEYISYLENSYMFFELQKFSPSIKQQLNSPRKIYMIDTAFHQVCGLTFTPNKGRNLENSVFIELKRKAKEIFYYSDKNECDFVIKQQNKITDALQVCYSLDDNNKEREINGLMDTICAFRLESGLILTCEQTDELIIKGKKIKIMPVLKWMLEANKIK